MNALNFPNLSLLLKGGQSKHEKNDYISILNLAK